MALDITLEDRDSVPATPVPHDESAEEAFERAVVAWRAARARIETVDPKQLSPRTRDEYFRMLARIGLWSDARMTGANNGGEEASGSADDAGGEGGEGGSAKERGSADGGEKPAGEPGASV